MCPCGVRHPVHTLQFALSTTCVHGSHDMLQFALLFLLPVYFAHMTTCRLLSVPLVYITHSSPHPTPRQADLAISPLKIVGYEGLFGTLGMLCFLLPLVQMVPGRDGQGVHEDSFDTWHVSGAVCACA